MNNVAALLDSSQTTIVRPFRRLLCIVGLVCGIEGSILSNNSFLCNGSNPGSCSAVFFFPRRLVAVLGGGPCCR